MADTNDSTLELGVSSTEPTDRQEAEEEDVPAPMSHLDRVLALHGVNIEGDTSDDDDSSYDDDDDDNNNNNNNVDQFILVEGENEEHADSESGPGPLTPLRDLTVASP